MHTLEAKEASDIATLTTQLNTANTNIANNTQNITAILAQDLTFTTEFIDVMNRIDNLTALEASDVSTIQDDLTSHYNRLNNVESILQLTSESLSEQTVKQANDLTTTNIHISDLGARITSLTTKEENDL